MTTFIAQAGLQNRYGAGGLARLASPIATLDAEATTRISQACADANSQVDGAVAGISLDLSGPPANLISIAARLAARRLWVLTWSSRVSTGVPKAIADDANQAEVELAAIQTGVASGDGVVSPPQTVAGQFSWEDIGNAPATDNPRTTVAHRMRRLP
jgi:hypothetical protein